METQLNKDERIEIRISASDKQIFQKAQKISGDKTFSGFVIRIVKKQAEEIIAQHDQILASEKDRGLFFKAVFEEIIPNENLIKAAKNYKISNK